MSWVNLNNVVNAIGDAQNVEPGSWEWLLGGVAAYSGSTGEHSSYGWRHHHKVSPDYVRAVIANYAHRGTYYQSAPERAFGYTMGGRPMGWKPEDSRDLPDGRRAFLTQSGVVTTTGPEVEHFWLDPLWALIDEPSIPVNTPFGTFGSDLVARVLAQLQVDSLIGQITSPQGKPYPWGYGDRGNARIFDTFVQSANRDIVPARPEIEAEFVTDVFLPFYERTPGIGVKAQLPRPNKVRVMTFNGLAWLLPVVYDAYHASTADSTTDRLMDLVQRWSQWWHDLEVIAPGRAFDINSFYAPADETFWQAPKPVDTLAGLVTEDDLMWDEGLSWEAWGYRACSVAAEVIKSPELIKARDDLAKRYLLRKPQWIVNYERKPVLQVTT